MFYNKILIYINSFTDDNQKLYLDNINNYRYLDKEFITEIKLRKKENIEDNIEVFCIISDKDTIDSYEEKIHQDLNNKFNNFIKGQKKEKGSNTVEDSFLNIYYDSVINELEVHYPKTLKLKNNDNVYCLFLYYTSSLSEDIEEEIYSIANLLLKNEQPYFSGKQIMIESFELQDIKDRKILTILPSSDSEGWYALLEGGIKLYLSNDHPYQREKINHEDIYNFTPVEIDNYLSNSCYAYSELLNPNYIYEEWLNVFLYALSVLPIEYNIDNFKLLFEEFYNFIQNKICQTIKLPKSIITKEEFYEVLIIKINQIRLYTTGLEEEGVSKNFLLLLKSKYVYLPVVYKIIAKRYRKEVNNRLKVSIFDLKTWNNLLTKVQESQNNYEKGHSLESVAEYFINHIEGFKITGKRVRTDNEEIDLIACNISENSFLWTLGAVTLIECKNWHEKIDVKVIRNIAYLIENKGINSILLFTRNGITSCAKNEILRQASHNKYIIVFDLNDLLQVNLNNNPLTLLSNKLTNLILTISNDINQVM